MNLTFRPALVGTVLVGSAIVVLSNCGSSSATTYVDAEVVDAGPIADARLAEAGADAVRPPPMSGEGNLLLVGGAMHLLKNGPPCTNEVGTAGDRWCAFDTQSSNAIGATTLLVLNVSKAAAGVAIDCGGRIIDPNCLSLTRGFIEDTTHAALFQGDTLVYFDRNGTPYGWRPGMPNGRPLVNDLGVDVHDCLPSTKGTSILCLRDLASTVAGSADSELLVGQVDGAGSPPLTKVDTVIPDVGVAAGLLRFRVGFDPGGDFVAWSTRETMTGPEILKVQRVGDDSTRATVATDVSRWSISPDGTSWYWLSHFNYDVAGMRSGTLQMAPFPSGAAPTTLLPSVGDFSVSRSGSIAARAMVSASHGELKGIVAPTTAPTEITSIDTNVVAVRAMSAQGYVAYAKNTDVAIGLIDLYLARVDGTGTPCTVWPQATGHPSVLFLPGSGAMVWARVTNLDSTIDQALKFRQSFTRLSDCTTTTVAADVGPRFGIAGDDAILFVQDFDTVDGTLRIQGITGGNTVMTAAPALIHTRVDDFLPVAPSPGVVLFTVNTGSTLDGLYLHKVGPSVQVPDGQLTDGGTQ